MRRIFLTITACAPFLAVAACKTTPAVTDACDVLVVIPDAPADVNRILVERARQWGWRRTSSGSRNTDA
jgi:hypothetical protein